MFFTLAFLPTYSTTGDSGGISSSRRSAPGRVVVRSQIDVDSIRHERNSGGWDLTCPNHQLAAPLRVDEHAGGATDERRKRRLTETPCRQVAVPNAADDLCPPGLCEDRVAAREPVDGVNHARPLAPEQSSKREPATDIESTGAGDDRQRIAERSYRLAIRTDLPREAHDSDWRPFRAA